jgi:hypothetical protein
MPPEDCRGSIAASLVGKPARIVTVDSRQTRSLIRPVLEKLVTRIPSPASASYGDCGIGTVFSEAARLFVQDRRLLLPMQLSRSRIEGATAADLNVALTCRGYAQSQ